MAHHYVYGSGMRGCLFDNGPHTSNDLEHAIQALEETFADTVSEPELLVMRNSLREQGSYSFENPSEAGAQHCEVTQEESDPKVAALAEHLDVSYGSVSDEGNNHYECDEHSGEWLVLDDGEADSAMNDRLECYIDDCLEIPDWIRPYFDRKAWKRDALTDGRGLLASYDDHEHEQQIDDVTYYIYRVG